MAYTTIDDPSAYFQTLLYTGDGGSDRTINFDGNSDLQPDFLWVKKRSATQNHYLANTNDSISKVMYSNDSGVEANETSQFKSVHSDGWVQGTDNTNTNTATFVAWGWKCNGGTRVTFTESGNNPGGGYQANTTAGFSIIDYTGTGATGTVSHGLGVVPELIICKQRSNAESWGVYHGSNTASPETDYMILDTIVATADNSNRWGDTAPTSSVFTVDTANEVNTDARTYVAYVFTSIQGYSKFGGYTGNGNADGPFIYTGFKPAWVMIKPTANLSSWSIHDVKRDPFNNGSLRYFFANGDNAEATRTNFDILSNGFKVRTTDNDSNYNGGVMIYMAFAEHPFVSSEGVPATAR